MVLRSETSADNDHVEENPQSQNWVHAKTPQALRKGQLRDPLIKQVVQWKENSPTRPACDEVSHLGPECKYYWSQSERLEMMGESYTCIGMEPEITPRPCN